MEAIRQLLRKCHPENPIIPELAEKYIKEPEEYALMAREWTRRYAH
jgi:ubiquitin-protein ligase